MVSFAHDVPIVELPPCFGVSVLRPSPSVITRQVLGSRHDFLLSKLLKVSSYAAKLAGVSPKLANNGQK